ncbi:hypothetical protein L7F22_003610 [Adiantum nelumboides]|nr:hypothetical protein [Adiantum nelumboides]
MSKTIFAQLNDEEQHAHPQHRDVKYRIVKYESWGNLIWAVLTCLIPPLRFSPAISNLANYQTHPEIEQESQSRAPVWQENASRIILVLLLALKLPLALAGIFLEWFLNFYHANDGLIGLLSKLIMLNINGIILSPKETDRSTYYSVIGWLDQRMDLLYRQSSQLKVDPNTGNFHYDSKIFADLCVMASKLAYESRNVQEPIVNKQWNMCFQQFYEWQNARDKPMGNLQSFINGTIALAERHLGKIPILGPILDTLEDSTALRPKTQAFMFTDKPTDADLVVLAFRGTEPFSADDWSTDLDFSFIELDDVIGKLHVGFLEALGLVDRDEIEESSKRLKENLNDPNEELTTGLSIGKIESMAAKNLLPSVGFQEQSDMKQSNVVETVKHELAYRVLGFERISADLIQLLKENPKAQLVMTGHSLGGALAALFAALILYDNVQEGKDKKVLVERLAAVYTFGQPRIGDEVFASFMDRTLEKHKMQYYRVVYAYDLVPRVPFDDRIFGFKHFGFCCYNNILYQQKALFEQPNRNFVDVVFSMVMRVLAVWELVTGVLLNRVLYGDDFKDSGLMAFARFVALLIPGIVAHAPTNYVNAVRLGPSRLKIVPFDDALSL